MYRGLHSRRTFLPKPRGHHHCSVWTAYRRTVSGNFTGILRGTVRGTSQRSSGSFGTMQPEDRINLHLGWPNPSLLPHEALKVAADRALSDHDIAVQSLEYGPDTGYQPLREELARWLTGFYTPADRIPAERICITGGASQSLASILQVFTDPLYTRGIWMVAPTYFLACRIFDDAGFVGKLRSIPEDDEGVNIDFLLQHIKEVEQKATADGNESPHVKPSRPWRKFYKHVIYAVPTFSNPSGKMMSQARREQLVRVAREFDALIVTDDVYDMLQWPSSSAELGHLSQSFVPRIVDVDRYLDGGPIDAFGHAASNGSFSKIAGPGCRTGWVEGTEALASGLSQCGSSRSGGCPSQLVASCIHQLLANNALQDHIAVQLQPAYARRYHTLMAAITEKLVPLGVSMPAIHPDVAGGYFIWLKLPSHLSGTLISDDAAEQENLIVSKGQLFQVQGEMKHPLSFDSNLRLSFAYEREEKLAEGIARLARVISRHLK